MDKSERLSMRAQRLPKLDPNVPRKENCRQYLMNLDVKILKMPGKQDKSNDNDLEIEE